jgi:hypothetical protein
MASMAATPLPDLIFYSRPGCHLCEGTRETLSLILEERGEAGLAVPRVVERDITQDAARAAQFGDRIPVLELGDRRLELVASAARIRRLLTDGLG